MSSTTTHSPVSESHESTVHIPVLLQETIDGLDIHDGDVVFDGTLGGGGHSYEILKRYPKIKVLIGTDLDPDALSRVRMKCEHTVPKKVFVETNFKNVARVISDAGEDHVDRMLLDLGVSTFSFFSSGRGFSFMKNEPLQMTFGSPEGALVTAETVVNTWEENSLRDIIHGFGEERHARAIARAIVKRREEKPFTTTDDLVQVIESVVPKRGKIHPATKTFQALRIAVNDELGNLSKALDDGFRLLSPGGRIAIISFHSLEDRIIKRFFKEKSALGEGTLITRRPLVPGEEELQDNKRSRSAKLRIIEKND